MIVGPSYTLNARKADVQRCVNLMPTPLEAPGGKSQMYLAPVPGLRQFGADEAPLLTTRFFAYDPSVISSPPQDLPTTAVLVGRTAFVAALTGYQTEDCEGITPVYQTLGSGGTNVAGRDPTLTFGGITCTTTGTQTIADPSNVRTFGRANTTAGGSKFIESRYDEASTGTMPLTTLEFSAPIAAFGAYVVDVDDFGSSIRIWVTDTAGKRYPMSFPLIGGGDTSETSIAFFGFVARGVQFTKIEIARDDNFSFWDGFDYYGATTDQIGLDDIMVATAAQVIAEPQGSPFPWTTSYGLETWCGLHFNALVTGQTNRFYDSGEFGLTEDVNAIDSASNSTTAGTWVTDGDFHGKAYACIGHRVTLSLPSLASRGGLGFLSRCGLSVEFEFKRTGSRVGTGEIIVIPNLVTIRCTASHVIEAVFSISSAPDTLTITGTAALAVGDKVHVRVMGHTTTAAAYMRLGIFIDGVLDADTGSGLSGQESSFGSATVSTISVGGKDASNYTPGIIDEVRCSNVLPGLFANFTPPAAPFREIYPPGYTTSPDVEAA